MLKLPQNVIDALEADTRYIVPRVKIYLDGEGLPPRIFEKDDLINCKLFTELGNKNEFAVGTVCSSTLDLGIYNPEGEFTPTNEESPYFRKLIPGIKVEVEVLVDIDLTDNFYPIAMGTFFTAEWVSAAGSGVCDVLAYDRLYWVLNEEVQVIPMWQNISGATLIRNITTRFGIPDVIIDSTIGMPIMYAYVPSGKVGDILADIARGCATVAYIDRDNKFVFKNAFSRDDTSISCVDHNWLYDLKATPSLAKQYDRVRVEVNNIGGEEDVELATFTDIEIPSGRFSLENMSFNKGPVVSLSDIVLENSTTTRLVSQYHGAYAGSFTFENSGAPEVITVRIKGTTLKSNVSDVTEGAYGARSTEFKVSSNLIQDATFAAGYGRALFNLGNTIIPQATITARGIPHLDMGDSFLLDSARFRMKVQVAPIQITHDLTNGMTTDIVCVPYSDVSGGKSVFLNPTFDIQAEREENINAKFTRRR